MNLDTGIHQNHLRAPPSTSEHVRAPPSTFDSGELRPTQRLPPSPQHTARRRFLRIVRPHPKPEHVRARPSTSDSGEL